MRTIKFRAWDKPEEKMIYGKSHFGLSLDGHIYYGNAKFDTYPIEIMQITGLLDKNNKEIWEGDLLAYDDKESEYVDVGFGEHNGVKVAERDTRHFFPVEFRNGEFGLDIQTHNTGEVQDDGWFSLSTLINLEGLKLEVIGNTYESPELL